MPGRMNPAEKTSLPPPTPVIPTLVEVKPDGLYLVAYCPVCDKSEMAKVKYAGESRERVDSVIKIRAHLQRRHRTAVKRIS